MPEKWFKRHKLCLLSSLTPEEEKKETTKCKCRRCCLDKFVFCIPLEFKRAAVFGLSHKQLNLFQIAANEPMRSLTNYRRKWEYYCLVDSIQHICHIELAADKINKLLKVNTQYTKRLLET